MKKEFVLNALRSEGYEVELCDHNKRDGRWQVGNDIFEVHPGYRNNQRRREGTVDTIVSGKQGWKRKAFDLNGVAQALQKALEKENTETGLVQYSASLALRPSRDQPVSDFPFLSSLS